MRSLFRRLSDTLLNLVDSVDAAVALDEEVSLVATVNYLGTECSGVNNTASVYDIVVGSIDPNDKQVLVQHQGVASHTEIGDTIMYKIRFQNVGNYAARRVLITDTLSPYLDWSTVEILESSHSFSTAIVDGIITWVNNNIELPDSTSDPEGSNGCVTFSVRLRQDCPSFTMIENDAAIQFDYNEFIITNNTKLLVIPEAKLDDQIHIYPNPAQTEAEIVVLNDDGLLRRLNSVMVVDLNGRAIWLEEIDTERYLLDVSSFESGVYTIKMIDSNGNVYADKLVVK